MDLPKQVCEKCGRTYQRHSCPYCLKEQRWDKMTVQEQIPGLTPRMYNNLEKITNFEHDTNPRSCYCFGPASSGKTTFAIRMLYKQAKEMFITNKQRKIAVIKMSELQDELLASDKSYEVLDKYKKAEWLLIDDIGVDKDNEWMLQIMYSIIDYRYEWMLQTILTSNISLLELAKKLGSERITRRIAAMCEQLKFKKTWHKSIG